MNKISLIVLDTTGRKGLTYMKIEYSVCEAILRAQGAHIYDVTVDGKTILECLTEAELDALTIGEIKRLAGEVTAALGGTARVSAG